MKIAVVGTGYVGLVSGTCFASIGHEVICIDNNQDKIDSLNNKGIIPIYEPDLEDLVKENVAQERLEFTTDLKTAVAKSDVVFIAVGTPPRADNGQADLKYVYQVAEEIGQALDGFTVVVDKSTVPIGTADEVTAIIEKTNPQAKFAVVSNPEFLREGFAIDDFLNGDRVVVGVENKQAEKLMQEVYAVLKKRGVDIVMTKVKTAEMIKYASNTFLATKLGFINEIADLCEKVGADVQEVAYSMGLDTRIGAKFLQAGPGYGGSCFPKDTMALEYIAKQNNCDLSIISATIQSNYRRKANMAEKVAEAIGSSLDGKTVGVLGLAFKGNTDDTRESPAIEIIKVMQGMGANIRAFDPAAMDEAKYELSNIHYCEDEYEVCENSDVLVILTEWDSFANLDLQLVKAKLSNPIIVDLRNMYNIEDVTSKGLEYYSIGR